MARILSIDYGLKKCGIAATDPLQIIVSGLETIPTTQLDTFLKEYCDSEDVEEIVLGVPHHPDGEPAQIAPIIRKFAEKLSSSYPKLKISLHDETYTSKHAKRIILKSGLKRKKRRNKHLVDKVSAILILQDYLEHI